MPAFSASTSSAASVGSPLTRRTPLLADEVRVVAQRGGPQQALRRPGSAAAGNRPAVGAELAGRARSPTPVTSSSRPLDEDLTHRHLVPRRVPVLSEQMTVVQPSVSTAGSRRMIARRRAAAARRSRAPGHHRRERFGTAAIARLTPQISISSGGLPRTMPSSTTTADTPRHAVPSRLPM